MGHTLELIPIGPLPPDFLESLAGALSESLSMPCLHSGMTIDPGPFYNAQRGQYDGQSLVARLEAHSLATETLVLGVTEVDLYLTVFTYVFGVARQSGSAAVISLHRLRTSFYGLPEDADVLMTRTRREAVHEVGHLLGKTHCPNRSCAMSFSATAQEIDLKQDRYCPRCAPRDLATDARRIGCPFLCDAVDDGYGLMQSSVMSLAGLG